MPVNFTSSTPNARPRPKPPIQPRKKPTICQSASKPRQPGITGSPWKWHLKNQRLGLTSNSATTSPLPLSPPSSVIEVMRSNISMGGMGSCALPGPNNSPRAQASRPAMSKLDLFTGLSNVLFLQESPVPATPLTQNGVPEPSQKGGLPRFFALA